MRNHLQISILLLVLGAGSAPVPTYAESDAQANVENTGVPAPASQSSGNAVAGNHTTASNSLTVHSVQSERQSSPTIVRVLEPDQLRHNKRYPVIYVLPVEAGEGRRWGDSVTEVLTHDLHNKHQAIFVFPTFARLPWYTDHPTDVQLQQESYLLQDVIPLVELKHPVRKSRSARLLVGFSKSGWGAWSLLLRHPDVFARAAAFDAPLMMNAPGKYGSGPIFGTAENFRHYEISELMQSMQRIRTTRLALLGRGTFHAQHQQMIALASSLQIPLYINQDQDREHSWHSGWLPIAVRWLQRSTLTCGRGGRENADENGIAASQNGYIFR